LIIKSVFLAFVLCLSVSAFADSVANKQKVLGAGPSTKIASVFFTMFGATTAAAGHSFTVEQRSTKHAGGIRASNTFLFGRTGRPLSDKEKAQGKRDLFLASVPVGFVVGEGVAVKQLSVDQARSVFCGKNQSWKELGGNDLAIHLVGREPTEASLMVLRKFYPFLDEAKYDRILKRDHAVINFLKTDQGAQAIAYGPLLNFAPVHRIDVPGYAPGLSMGLVYDVKNANHPIVRAAITFAASDEWLRVVSKLGFLPASSEQDSDGSVTHHADNGC